jgi:hypothetical protein
MSSGNNGELQQQQRALATNDERERVRGNESELR